MVVLGLGSLVTPPLPQIRRLGEPSYGMYIWAYPVQQILVQELSPRSGMLTLLTLVIVIPLGYASWHLVEKRFLRQK
jgi:peptidoglycan/LPS O-acetylase OafA/YrhL